MATRIEGAETGNVGRRRAAALLILVAGAALPAWIAVTQVHGPEIRDIHIEAYRYVIKPDVSNYGIRLSD